MKRKGFGAEDSPYMILATVAVLMLVVWIGVGVMAGFVEGNEHQAAVEAAMEIYKSARLLSLGYDGSSDRLAVTVPEGYAVAVDGRVAPLKIHWVNGSAANATELVEPMGIRGVDIAGAAVFIPPGERDVTMVYNAKDGEVYVSW